MWCTCLKRFSCFFIYGATDCSAVPKTNFPSGTIKFTLLYSASQLNIKVIVAMTTFQGSKQRCGYLLSDNPSKTHGFMNWTSWVVFLPSLWKECGILRVFLLLFVFSMQAGFGLNALSECSCSRDTLKLPNTATSQNNNIDLYLVFFPHKVVYTFIIWLLLWLKEHANNLKWA